MPIRTETLETGASGLRTARIWLSRLSAFIRSFMSKPTKKTNDSFAGKPELRNGKPQDAVTPSGTGQVLRYEPSPKHKLPWQPGRKGTLCPPWSHKQATTLLAGSVPALKGKRRYATIEGVPFCGHEHLPGVWHGHPVGWTEVPPLIRLKWVREGKVTKRQVKVYWSETSQDSDE